MQIEAKDSVAIYNLLHTAMTEDNRWVVLPGDKSALTSADIKTYATFANAAEGTANEKDHILLLFALFVELAQANRFTDNKELGSIPLPTPITLDMQKIEAESAQEAQVQRKVESILTQIQPYGFGAELSFDLRFELQFDRAAFTVNTTSADHDHKISYQLKFRETDGPVFESFKATLRTPLPAVTGNIGMVNISQLNKRMSKVDWKNELLDNKQRPDDPFVYDNKDVPGILKALELLEGHSIAGKEMAGLLKFKFWEATPNEHLVPLLKAYQLEFNKSITIRPGHDPNFTKSMAANFLSGRAVATTAKNGKTIWHHAKDGRFRIFEETGNATEITLKKMPLEFASAQEWQAFIANLRNGDPVEAAYKGGTQKKTARIEVDPPHGIRAYIKGTKIEVLENFNGMVAGLGNGQRKEGDEPTPEKDEHPYKRFKR